MNFFVIGFLIMQAARLACGTCVFESDFGFILNCNFKKSGLFRVRNLGGLKAHFGLGFSLGDELGFGDSLGNLEGGRRRAISYKNGPPNLVGVLPAMQQEKPVQQHPLPDKRIISRSPQQHPYGTAMPETLNKPAVAPKSLMTEARPLPMGVPVFRPLPNAATVQVAQRRVNVDTQNPRVRVNNQLVESYAQTVQTNRTFHATNTNVAPTIPVPAFQAMPESIARIGPVKSFVANQNPISQPKANPNYLQFEEPKFDLKDVTVEELAAAANVSVETIKHAIYVREQQMKAEQRAMLAAKLREEFMRTSTVKTTTTSTTTTNRPRAFVHAAHANRNVAHENKVSKVMNAPKEYYPVGYEKNFDDNFKSKVDLPPTTFNCGKQKHFPGLYADTDLGCMVFHVCALTDDGLVRKSFLCPESTLFDQTILKCNWWFYVDCNASKGIYDSNIPISKSYQLMKSLTYFSKYNKKKDNENDTGLDLQNLKDSMEIAARNLKNDDPTMKPTTIADATDFNIKVEDQETNEA